MPDTPGSFQLLRVVQDTARFDFLPIGKSVAVVDHAHVEVIRPQELHHLVKARPGFRHVPCALVLPVLPDRADMGLDIKLVPPPGKGVADGAAHVGIRRVEVEIIDPAGLGQVEQRLRHLAAVLGKALAAHADLADREPGISQFPILHTLSPTFR